MSVARTVLILAVLATCANHVEAGHAPSLTQQTTLGVWETVVPNDIRVLTMELRETKSLLAMSVGRSRPVTTVFDVDKWSVDNAHRLHVHAVGINTTDQLIVSGTGNAIPADGRIEADIVLEDVRGRELNHWHSTFVDLGGHYFETLITLAQDGKDHISKLRSPGR